MNNIEERDKVFRVFSMVESICPNKKLARDIIHMKGLSFSNVATETWWKYVKDGLERCSLIESDFKLVKEYMVELLFDERELGLEVIKFLRSLEPGEQGENLVAIKKCIHEVLENLGDHLASLGYEIDFGEFAIDEFRLLVRKNNKCVLFGHLYLDSQHRVFPSAQSKMDVENLLRMSLTELADILRKIDSCDDEDIKDVLYFLHNLK